MRRLCQSLADSYLMCSQHYIYFTSMYNTHYIPSHIYNWTQVKDQKNEVILSQIKASNWRSISGLTKAGGNLDRMKSVSKSLDFNQFTVYATLCFKIWHIQTDIYFKTETWPPIKFIFKIMDVNFQNRQVPSWICLQSSEMERRPPDKTRNISS